MLKCGIKRSVRTKKDVAIDKLIEHYRKGYEWNEVLFYINRLDADIKWIYSTSPKWCYLIKLKDTMYSHICKKVPDFV